jgi:hypothetical protein
MMPQGKWRVSSVRPVASSRYARNDEVPQSSAISAARAGDPVVI